MAGQSLRLEVILAALDKATGPFKQIMGGSTALGRSIKATSGTLKKLNEQQSKISGFRKLKNETAESGNAFKAAQQKATQLRTALAGMESPTRAATSALNKAEKASAKLKNTHVGNLRALRDSRNAMTAAGVSARTLGSHEQRLRTEIDAASAAMKRQQTRLGNMQKVQQRAAKLQSGGLKATVTGAAMAYGGQRVLRSAAAPVGAAMQFESSMADVRKVIDFDTPEQFAQMGRDVENLSMHLPMLPGQIAQIVAAAGQAGVARNELLQFASDATKMGVAFDSTAEEAGQTMATWRTAFRMGQADVVTLADKINYLGNTGPANVQKISDVVNRIGALGEVAGLQSGPLAALGATVAGMGVGSEISATGIKNLLLTLGSGAAATKKQQLAFKALGIDSVVMAKAMQKDAGGAILSVLEKIQRLPKAEQTPVLTRLFGRESVGAIAPMLTNLDLLRTNLNKVTDAKIYAGSMEKEYAARVATSENAMQLAKNTAVVLAQSIGKTLIPDIKALAERVGGVVEKLVAWIRENPALVRTIALTVLGGAALVTVLGALLIAAGTAAMAFGQIHGAMSIISGGRSLGMLVGGLGRIAPLLAGIAVPALPVIAVIAAIAGAALLIWKYWQPIKAFFIGVWQGLREAMAPVMAEFATALAPLAPLWDMLASAMGKAWAWIKQLFTPFQATSAQLQTATGYGSTFGRVLGTVLSVLLLPLRALAGLVGLVAGLIITHWSAVVSIFRGGLPAALVALWQVINSMLGGWPAKFLGFGVALIQGFINGIKSMAGAVKDAVVGSVSGAVDRFKGFLGIKSPSRLFAQFGTYTMQGLAGGLQGSAALPLRALDRVSGNMRKIGAGVAIAAAMAPAAAIDNRPPVTAGAAGGAVAGATYNITINAGGSGQPADIAAAVRDAIAKIDREQAARKRSALSDYE